MRERGFFKMVLILVLAGACVLPNPTKAQTSTANGLPALTVLVRHAEKVRVTDEDVPLSSAGMARADVLAAVLRNIKFSAILATDYMRTIQTAQPTAVALGSNPRSCRLGETLKRTSRRSLMRYASTRARRCSWSITRTFSLPSSLPLADRSCIRN